jgi:hypothetical protein
MTISEIILELTALANRVEYDKQFNTVKEVAKAIDELRVRIETDEEFDRITTKHDPVNHPSHYTQGNIECIDAMQAAYGKESVMHFCKCNAFKYQWRFDKKNGEEDIKKAQWYQNKFLELKRELKHDTK